MTVRDLAGSGALLIRMVNIQGGRALRLPVALAILAGASFAAAGHPDAFAKILPRCLAGKDTPEQALPSSPGRNQLLHLYEAAGLCQLQGDFGRSRALFDRADAVAREKDGRALASVTGGLAQGAAVAVNDAVLPWDGSACDRVLSRTLNAINYLALGDREGALVEVRKAEAYQAVERERSRRTASAARDPALAPGVAARCGPMAAFTRQVPNSYENAFTYYLSSQIYRSLGRRGLDDARIDLARARELAPRSTAASWRDPAGPGEGPPGTGEVVVLYQAGLVPALAQASVDLPLADGTLLCLAFPFYKDFGHAQPPLQITAPTGSLAAGCVADLRPLVVKALQERMPGLIARGVLGAAAKAAGQRELGERHGELARLFAALTTKAVTAADLRSWLSLPAELQAASFPLAPGAHELTLRGADWSRKVAVDVAPGGTTFVCVRAVPGFQKIHTASFKPDA